MVSSVQITDLIACGILPAQAEVLTQKINGALTLPAEAAWKSISQTILASEHPFKLKQFVFEHIFPTWHEDPASAPAWIPSTENINTSNLQQVMTELQFTDLEKFHRWAHTEYADFWQCMMKKIGIVFKQPYTTICDFP